MLSTCYRQYFDKHLKINYMSMTKQEIKQEANRLRKKSDECEYYATTLTHEHQKSMKAELEAKARELRELQKEYERLS